ncbi:uncharacterized protein LOC106137708 [Amyelois transitella]|uniref:uncharacterized protein LOC106137708 n=1 Tax=Amyelois transitella TaxID=680683 RepID=UPI0029902768|nr:uncharacterized protein LOC106137708 [Amyelois transitella]
MQVNPENSESNDNQTYSPLIYKIARPNNEERVMKLERKKRRLVKEAVGNWPDPFHPEYCERTCLKAYKQAVGLLPYDPNNPECSCEEAKYNDDEDVCSCCEEDDDSLSSDCSSLDINWEIHFTPPCLSKENDNIDQ